MKTILSKIAVYRKDAGSTLYTNEITQTMDRYFLDLKNPQKSILGGVKLFEPDKYDDNWTIGIKIPGAVCGQIFLDKEGEGTLSTIWLIKDIATDGKVCFVKQRFAPQMYFALQEYIGDKLILPKDNTIAKGG